MALDLQLRSAQYGQRRHHIRYETVNRSIILQADPIKDGGIATCGDTTHPYGGVSSGM
jgi:hypothetical protein